MQIGIYIAADACAWGVLEWLWTYNNERPNMAIGGITPKQKLLQSIQRAA
jgi:hypothetical protein